MKAYTEGPWEVRIWDGEDWPEKRISVGATDGGHSVCVSPRYRWNLEDFNLIAAAPDLYEALEAIVNSGEWYTSALEIDPYNPVTDKILDGYDLEKIAKAALAKARGE